MIVPQRQLIVNRSGSCKILVELVNIYFYNGLTRIKKIISPSAFYTKGLLFGGDAPPKKDPLGLPKGGEAYVLNDI